MTSHTPPASHFDKTVYFLIICCKAAPSQADLSLLETRLEEEILPDHTHQQLLLSAASRHGILPLLHKRLPHTFEHTTGDKNRTAFFDNLRQKYRQIAKRNMFMSAELLRITALLQSHRIEMLAFKGPLLSQKLYGDITLRQFGDLDLLIHKKDLQRVLMLLTDAGYLSDIRIPQERADELYDLLTVIGFIHPDTGLRIEIHWELLSKNYAIDWHRQNLWEAAERIIINHTPVPALAFEHQLLYLCIHGSKHLFERLEWICDIDRYIRATPSIDWQYLYSMAKEQGTLRMFLLGLFLAQTLFDLPLPDFMEKKIHQDKVLPVLVEKIITLHFSTPLPAPVDRSYFFLLLQMRERPLDKLRFIWSAFFAPQFNDFNYLPLPGYLHFLYPAVRLVRLGRKYLKPS